MGGADPCHFFDLGLGFVGIEARERGAFLHVDECHDGVGFAVGATFHEDVAEFETGIGGEGGVFCVGPVSGLMRLTAHDQPCGEPQGKNEGNDDKARALCPWDEGCQKPFAAFVGVAGFAFGFFEASHGSSKVPYFLYNREGRLCVRHPATLRSSAGQAGLPAAPRSRRWFIGFEVFVSGCFVLT